MPVFSRLRRGSAILAIVLAACGKDTTPPVTSYVVGYSVVTTGTVTLDSVRYDNGHGTFVKVAAPTAPWTQSLVVATGGTVEAQAWGQASFGSSAKIRAIMVVNGVGVNGDSTSFAAVGAPAAFSIGIAKRTLF